VWDHDYLSRDDPMGQAALRVRQVKAQQADSSSHGHHVGLVWMWHPSTPCSIPRNPYRHPLDHGVGCRATAGCRVLPRPDAAALPPGGGSRRR
jgi:hypothetical protein